MKSEKSQNTHSLRRIHQDVKQESTKEEYNSKIIVSREVYQQEVYQFLEELKIMTLWRMDCSKIIVSNLTK